VRVIKLVGAAEQQAQHFMYDASGSIVVGGTPQLLLPRHQARAYFYFENTSSANLVLEFGAARATCALSGASISSSFTITNSGFGYTRPPLVRFLGGGYPQVTLASGQPAGLNSSYVGAAGPNFPAPPNAASAIASLSGGSVNAITLVHPGSGYVVAPMLFMINDDLDPIGVATPSATVGIIVTPYGSVEYNGTSCPTDAVAVYGGTTSQAFVCKFMT
jgi:hypothetical protein